MRYQPQGMTVESHLAFRQSLSAPQPAPFDEIDEMVAAAELDLQPRSRRQTNNVLRILDQLAGKTHNPSKITP